MKDKLKKLTKSKQIKKKLINKLKITNINKWKNKCINR